MKTQLIVASLLASLLTGCGVGPRYRRPAVNPPDAYRGDARATPPADARSLADEKWSEVFQDEELQRLIRVALEQNYDLRIAASRVLQARAQLGITRADQFPTVSGRASATNQRTPSSGPIPAIETSPSQVDLTLSWEADFWGKYRRGTEAARAELLASEWARQAVTTTLVADVATAYFQLRELDLELEIAQRTLKSRDESLKLVKLQEQHGTTSMLAVRQAEQLVYTAAGQIPDLERRIEQQENFISILLGTNPAAVPRGRKLTEQSHAPEVPPGLPSSLLERRPDIRQAEMRLVAANARLGVARAAFFPQVTLTSTGGYRSAALSDLFSGPAGLWSFAGALAQPLFAGGRIRSGVRLAEAQQQEAALVYQQTIQQAVREVSDALVASRKNREFRLQQERLTQSAQEAARLSDLRYRRGATSYLEVLDSDTRYFEAELGLAQAQVDELLALVQLYRSLGGGWQQ
ncbi:MAG: efflux transporter outer membrane subunit [Candidatus Acidiferrales bacterium]